MEHLYNDLVNNLRVLISAPPANQLEMSGYYRRILMALVSARDTIDDAIRYVRRRIEEYDTF